MAKGEAKALAAAARTATTVARVVEEGEKVDTVMVKAAMAEEWVTMAAASTTMTSTAMMVRGGEGERDGEGEEEEEWLEPACARLVLAPPPPIFFLSLVQGKLAEVR